MADAGIFISILFFLAILGLVIYIIMTPSSTITMVKKTAKVPVTLTDTTVENAKLVVDPTSKKLTVTYLGSPLFSTMAGSKFNPKTGQLENADGTVKFPSTPRADGDYVLVLDEDGMLYSTTITDLDTDRSQFYTATDITAAAAASATAASATATATATAPVLKTVQITDPKTQTTVGDAKMYPALQFGNTNLIIEYKDTVVFQSSPVSPGAATLTFNSSTGQLLDTAKGFALPKTALATGVYTLHLEESGKLYVKDAAGTITQLYTQTTSIMIPETMALNTSIVVGQSAFTFQEDANLVLYYGGRPIFNGQSYNRGGKTFKFDKATGKLYIVNGSDAEVWGMQPAGTSAANGPYTLYLTNSGLLKLVDKNSFTLII